VSPLVSLSLKIVNAKSTDSLGKFRFSDSKTQEFLEKNIKEVLKQYLNLARKWDKDNIALYDVLEGILDLLFVVI